MKWQVPKIWDEECWVICGGSSIIDQFNIPAHIIPETKEEFVEFGDFLSPIHNKRCIGVNIAAFLGDWVDVSYWGDSDTYTEYKSWYDKYAGLKISSAGKFDTDLFKDIKYLHKFTDTGFTTDPSLVSWITKNSGGSAVDVAQKLGAKTIYILGLDMYHHPSGRMHWHSGYPAKILTPTKKQLDAGKPHPRRMPMKSFNRHLKGWDEMAEEAKTLNIEIFNVNPKSEIKAFPRVSLNEALGI